MCVFSYKSITTGEKENETEKKSRYETREKEVKQKMAIFLRKYGLGMILFTATDEKAL